jgi:hypothetical protein
MGLLVRSDRELAHRLEIVMEPCALIFCSALTKPTQF